MPALTCTPAGCPSSDEALAVLPDAANSYPYVLQVYGQVIRNLAPDDPFTVDDATAAVHDGLKQFDGGCFCSRQGPPDRRGRGHGADQLPQVRQPLEVPDRLATGQLDQAQVEQDLAPVVDRVVSRPAHRGRDPGGQSGPFGQQPHRQQPGQRHAAFVVPDQFQPAGL